MATHPQAGVSRRALIGGVALGGVGLLLGLGPLRSQIAKLSGGQMPAFVPNAYVRLATDGTVTVVIGPSEMGQGIYTTLAAALADELDADWKQVTVEAASLDSRFGSYFFGGLQLTAASSSVLVFGEVMRSAGAAARSMLVQAAAQQWRLDPSALRTERGTVLGPDGRRASYGELAEAAARLPVPKPDGVKLKDPAEFKLMGRPIAKMENDRIVRGQLLYGIDFDHPGLLTAVVARAPVAGARLASFDAAEARKMAGVRGIYEIPAGIAVVADHYWLARQARDALTLRWDIPEAARLSSVRMTEHYRGLADRPGHVATRKGAPEAMLQGAGRALKADYQVPYLAHAPMEPLNCTIFEQDGGCDVWVGTQYQSKDGEVVSETLGLPLDKVRLHTLHMGGAFGRRGSPTEDVVLEAAQIAKAARGLRRPIKVMWAREEDIRGGFYRPMALSRIEAALGKDGLPSAWRHRIVSKSPMAKMPWSDLLIHNDVDETSVAGAGDLPYAIPRQLVELHSPTEGPTVQWMRSVGNSATCFAVESCIDELAHMAGQDPIDYRRRLLGKAEPRLLNVLNIVAERSAWGEGLGKGRGRGVALQSFWGTAVAQVAEVTVVDGRVRVDRVTAAVDCGRVLNPNIAAGQIEGGIIFGLSSALYGEITFDDQGQPIQSNFDSYPMVRMDACPRIDVHLVDSGEKPGGIGEVAVPHVGPAVCNAIFAAVGRRVRALPITTGGFSA